MVQAAAAADAAAAPRLASLLAEHGADLAFNILEVGAAPPGTGREPFYALPEVFPSSRIAALELDPDLCDTLNAGAAAGVRYYPCALGRTDETRTLYETAHPMCASLYEPDERYADAYSALDVMRVRSRREIRTRSLDAFVREHGVGPLDFLKMDIQGAELDVLEGGAATLAGVLALVTEVEFVPLYKAQPLFADVDAHLRSRGFMLHKLIELGGRVMKPLARGGTGTHPQQFLWSDALYCRDLIAGETLGDERRLKLAVLLDLYDSPDVALFLLRQGGSERDDALADDYLSRLVQSGAWSVKGTPER